MIIWVDFGNAIGDKKRLQCRYLYCTSTRNPEAFLERTANIVLYYQQYGIRWILQADETPNLIFSSLIKGRGGGGEATAPELADKGSRRRKVL